MTQNKKVLTIGIDPFLIDFTSPEFAAFPGLTAEKVAAGINNSMVQLSELGYEAEVCWTDFGETAETVVKTHLKKNQFDIVLIGAGIRIPPSNFFLFEKLVNTIHENAPNTKLCFNTNPMDTVNAVQRWT
jgi:hypothetical protein